MTNSRTAEHFWRYGPEPALFNRIASLVLAVAAFLALSLSGPAMAQGGAAGTADKPLTIVTLGDSLSAGYKLPRDAAFTSQLEAALKAKGYTVRVPNTGVSGETTAGGLARLDWILADKPDMVIVELGANDGLRGVDPATTRANLDQILTKLKERGVAVLLAGMLAPRNLGPEYGQAFDDIYPQLAKAHGVAFYPFFLEGVAMDPALNQEDGMHPTEQGVAVIVRNILPSVMGVLDGLKAG